jgi:RHS repeat-associated protein
MTPISNRFSNERACGAFTYNAAGQLQTVDDPFVTTAGKLSTYGYDATNGRLTSRTDTQANLAWTRAYEPDTGRLDTQEIKDNTTGISLARFDLGYDPAGNVTSKDHTGSMFTNTAKGTWTYAYDGASRLTQAVLDYPGTTPPSTQWDYAYDGVGNRVLNKQTTLPSTVTANWTTSYDGAGLPTSIKNTLNGSVTETITPAHDAIGELTKLDSTTNANDWAYAYDAYGRMSCAKAASTACTSGATRTLPLYDALDRTVRSTYNAVTTTNTYRGITETLTRQQVGTAITAYANTASGTPIAEKATNAYFYLRDPHGDVIGSVTTAGANQTTRTFDPYGGVLTATQTSGLQPVLGYQGDLTDPQTKLVDMGTRNYMPTTGRFMTRDVLAGDPSSPMSLNRFAYGLMSPLRYSDPTGMRAVLGEYNGDVGDPRSPNDGSNLCHSRCSYAPTTYRNPFALPVPAPSASVPSFVSRLPVIGTLVDGVQGLARGTSQKAIALYDLAGKRIGNEIQALRYSIRADRLVDSWLGKMGRSETALGAMTGLGLFLTAVSDYSQVRGEDSRNSRAEAAFHAAIVAGATYAGGEVGGLACASVNPVVCAMGVMTGGTAGNVAGDRLADAFIDPDYDPCAQPGIVYHCQLSNDPFAPVKA